MISDTLTLKQTLDAMKWGDWETVQTRRGEKQKRVCALGPEDQDFWALWKERGAAMKQAGYSVAKWQGDWQLTQWRTVERQEEPVDFGANSPDEITDDKPRGPRPMVEIGLDIKAKLRDWQVPSLRTLVGALQKYGKAVDGSDLGTGKTYVGLAACKVMGKRPFVVCPKAVKPSWERVCLHFGIIPIKIINYELIRMGTTSYGHWEITEPAKTLKNGKKKKEVRKFVWSLPADAMLIFDEAQKMKSPDSENCKMGLAALQQGVMTLGISGTIASNPTEMKFAGQLTGLHGGGGGYYAWMLRHGVIKGRFGMFYSGSPAILAKIHKDIYPERGTRIRRVDLPDFPETQIAAEAFDCGENTGKIQGAYDQMFKELAEIDTREFESPGAKAGAVLAIQMYARQRAEMLKVPGICEMVEDFVENGMSVVIFTNFRETVSTLALRLKTKCIVQGTAGPREVEEREKSVAAFQANQERVIIVNIQSGGAGLSLHDVHGGFPRASIICPTWSAMDFKQATGRICRDGGKSKSLQRVFYAAGTIEDAICTKVKDKMKNIDSLNDGDLAPIGLF